MFYSIEDLRHLPEPKWLIDDMFEQDALVMLVGPPGSLKSFLAIDWGLSLAVGRPWNGRATRPSRVLYALGEGKASLLKRIEAWGYHNKLSYAERLLMNANFRITFNVPQLAVQRDSTAFVEALDMDAFNPTVLVIDTFARSYVGKNENDPMDIGVWVDAADRLRQRGMAVLTLHHTKKNQEFGLKYRGSTALLGAMDTSFVLERSPEGYKGFARLSCDKQKDHQEPTDIWMNWHQIRPPGAIEGSIVLIETNSPSEADDAQRKEDDQALQLIVDSLMNDTNYKSDRERARALAGKLSIAESAAQSRIVRARKTDKYAIKLELDAEQELSAGTAVRVGS